MARRICNSEAERLARLARDTKAGGVVPLADDLETIALHCSRIPVRDSRTPEEILGYDEHGLPS